MSIDNLEKKFTYIVKIIDYKLDENNDFVISKWKNLLGVPYVNISGKLFGSKNMVKEDKRLVRDIFEHLIIGDIWKWK